MKLWLAKVQRAGKLGLIPTDEQSRAVLGRMADGECAEFSIVRPRSVPMHRMYFGICRQIGENQDPPRDEASIDYELRIRAGHYDVLLIGKDELLARIAKCLYAAIDQIRKNIRGLHTFTLLLEGLADELNERAEKCEVRVPKRIAFDKLTHDEWMKLWPSLELVIRENFGEEYIREAA